MGSLPPAKPRDRCGVPEAVKGERHGFRSCRTRAVLLVAAQEEPARCRGERLLPKNFQIVGYFFSSFLSAPPSGFGVSFVLVLPQPTEPMVNMQATVSISREAISFFTDKPSFPV